MQEYKPFFEKWIWPLISGLETLTKPIPAVTLAIMLPLAFGEPISTSILTGVVAGWLSYQLHKEGDDE